VDFKGATQVLPTGATVPTGFTKHIYFKNQRVWKCYYFPNIKPTKKWGEHQIKCNH
jgi:hypothetical protein